MRNRVWIWGLGLLAIGYLTAGVKLEKNLLYDQHTLQDAYEYNGKGRSFQWNKISAMIDSLLLFEDKSRAFGALSNYRNENGWAAIADSAKQNVHYRVIQDKYGVRRNQSVPLYAMGRMSVPERYGQDGFLVAIDRDSADCLWVRLPDFGGVWIVPDKYVDRLGGADFRKLVFVDRTNQNVATIERGDSTWLIRSMNPVTTGVKRPPYHWETPVGIYVVRKKLEKMYYLRDGKSGLAGYAPWASRFSGGAYLHGVPVAYPNKTVYEFSWSLGTVPRSHMCVRNATSHAKFLYDWAPVGEALVIVFD